MKITDKMRMDFIRDEAGMITHGLHWWNIRIGFEEFNGKSFRTTLDVAIRASRRRKGGRK